MKIKQMIKKIIPKKILNFRKKLKIDFPYRRYMDKHNCIFVHIPKTAGTSVIDALGGDPVNRSHVTAFLYKTYDAERFEEYYKFTFVRNPWDRVVSTYEYWLQGLDQTELYYQKLLYSKYNTFEQFVMNFLDKDTICLHFMLRPQYLYLYDYQDRLLVDFVGKFENIDHDIDVIFKKLHVENNLKKTNPSKRGNYQSYYKSQEMIDKISDLYKKDIELFDYKF